MYSKVNYTIVGLFVVIFAIGMAWFAFWLAKYGLDEDYYTYKIEMKDSIAGLSKDSSVKLHGVDIGRVSQIRIDPEDISKINIFVEIKKEVSIKEDMLASTQMLGITGLLSIEIHGGTNEAKTLVPKDGYIPTIKSKPSLLSKLTDNLGGLSEKLNSVLARSQLLLSDTNLEHISQILENVKKLSQKGEDVEQKVIESLKEMDTTLEVFRHSMTALNQNFTDVSNDFHHMKEVSIPTIKRLNKLAKNFDRLTIKVEKSLDRGDYSLKKILEPAVVDIQILTKELSAMSREFEQNPSGILFKSRQSRRGPGE